MAVKYFEASTMKDLYVQLNKWADDIFTEKWSTTKGISWVDIQKEGDKFTCIASGQRINVQVCYSAQLPVWVEGVDGVTNVNINPNGNSPFVRSH